MSNIFCLISSSPVILEIFVRLTFPAENWNQSVKSSTCFLFEMPGATAVGGATCVVAERDSRVFLLRTLSRFVWGKASWYAPSNRSHLCCKYSCCPLKDSSSAACKKTWQLQAFIFTRSLCTSNLLQQFCVSETQAWLWGHYCLHRMCRLLDASRSASWKQQDAVNIQGHVLLLVHSNYVAKDKTGYHTLGQLRCEALLLPVP